MTRFQETMERTFKLLDTYVPVVARVHGAHHPEFHEVRRLFEAIKAKVEAAGGGQADLAREFAQLRELTDNYKVPGDVCESYAAVYEMLAELDAAYQA